MEDYIVTDKGKQNWIMWIVSLTVFMFSLDYSMVNISLPVMAGYFGSTIASVSRIPLAYLLVVTSTVLLFGKLGDIKGFKKNIHSRVGCFYNGDFPLRSCAHIEYPFGFKDIPVYRRGHV